MSSATAIRSAVTTLLRAGLGSAYDVTNSAMLPVMSSRLPRIAVYIMGRDATALTQSGLQQKATLRLKIDAYLASDDEETLAVAMDDLLDLIIATIVQSPDFWASGLIRQVSSVDTVVEYPDEPAQKLIARGNALLTIETNESWTVSDEHDLDAIALSIALSAGQVINEGEITS